MAHQSDQSVLDQVLENLANAIHKALNEKRSPSDDASVKVLQGQAQTLRERLGKVAKD